MGSDHAAPSGGHAVDADHARLVVNAYIDAWNEGDEDRRRHLLTETMEEGAVYCDPTTRTGGHADLSAHISTLLDRYPGRRVVRTSDVDVHHDVCRFHWRLIKADGTQLPESVDFVEFGADGRLRRVVGFFGALDPVN